MIGILGGTFDPIHNGHLITARTVLEIRNLEKIILVPCSRSPHKLDIDSASNFDRLNMVKSAIQDFKEFEVSDFELMKGGVSYSIDTIKYFKEEYDEIDLIIGYDNLPKFDTWKDYESILELVNLVVMKRHFDKELKINKKVFDKAIMVETPFIEISSSNIRERAASGLRIDNLVPEEVKSYIEKKSIYSG